MMIRSRPMRRLPATTISTSSGPNKDEPAGTPRTSKPALDREGRGRSRQAGQIRVRRPGQAVQARGTDLPAPLRRGLVDGGSVAGLPAQGSDQALEPTAPAKFVEFTTLIDPMQMPGQRSRILPWPYVEGLRMDEAMHPLTLLATGVYGKPLPNQNGAPLRLVVPWKYGFKGGKSIVRIRFSRRSPDHLEHRGAERVRLLRQREPGGRSPALEPGPRAAARRVPQAQDAAVQRLRRPGRLDVCGNGSAEELLMGGGPAVRRTGGPEEPSGHLTGGFNSCMYRPPVRLPARPPPMTRLELHHPHPQAPRLPRRAGAAHVARLARLAPLAESGQRRARCRSRQDHSGHHRALGPHPPPAHARGHADSPLPPLQ